MELVIGLVIVAGLVWFFVFRQKEDVASALAPYKVETPEPVPPSLTKPVVESVIESAPIVPVVEQPAAKVKKPAKPKAKTPAKPATKPATKPAVIKGTSKSATKPATKPAEKATAKPKRTPKMSVAK